MVFWFPQFQPVIIPHLAAINRIWLLFLVIESGLKSGWVLGLSVSVSKIQEGQANQIDLDVLKTWFYTVLLKYFLNADAEVYAEDDG